MGVNSLPKTVTRQRSGCELNPVLCARWTGDIDRLQLQWSNAPSEYNRLRLVFLLPYLPSWAPLLRIGISKTGRQIFTKFSGFLGGHPRTSNPSKSRDLTRGFWGRGWGRKKFDPPYLPHLGVGGAKFIFPLGAPLVATLFPKTTSLTPTWAPLKIRDCFKKFLGVVPVHGVFEGVALVRMSHKFFWAFRTNKPPGVFFIFFEFRPRGELCPLKKW